jgi:hypothetical protein
LRTSLQILAIAAVCAGGAIRALAATPADKSAYSLLDPTPGDLLRPMNTDRPDVTESPITVDAGHVQLELSLVEYTYDDDGSSQFSQFSVTPANLKIGLLNNADIQFVFEPYLHQQIRTAGGNHYADGFGTAEIRFKLNLWGNDGGDTAFGVMPFVAFPTTADNDFGLTHHVEGGVILPLQVSLPHDWTLATMAEFDFLRDADDSGYGTQLVHTLALHHKIVGELEGYVEYVGNTSVDLHQGYIAQFDAGVLYAVSPDIQLDAGANFGIRDAADDVLVFVGISARR